MPHSQHRSVADPAGTAFPRLTGAASRPPARKTCHGWFARPWPWRTCGPPGIGPTRRCWSRGSRKASCSRIPGCRAWPPPTTGSIPAWTCIPDPRITGLEADIERALIDAFDDQTPAFKRYEPASFLDTASYRLDGTPIIEVIGGLMRGRDRSLILLAQAVRALQQQIDSAA